MKGVLRLNEIKELLKSEKAIKIIIIVCIVLVVIIAAGGIFGVKNTNGDIYSRYALTEYERSLEKRLSGILSAIDGVGKLEVMITLDTSEQNEYGKNKDMIISVKSPYVRGVAVVCDGGDNIIVREKVINAVSGVFGISTARVSVIK